MMMKIALVTGGNRGIGLETVRRLAAEGVQVLMGSRSVERGEAARAELGEAAERVEVVALDMASPASIQAAVNHVRDRYGRLDILVNNAGVMPETGSGVLDAGADLYREAFEVNLFAVIDLTQAALPLLEKSEAGRIVMVSSILASTGLHADPGSPIYGWKHTPAYNASKTALNSYTVHLAAALAGTSIKVNAIHPGWIKTEMGGPQAPTEVAEGVDSTLWAAGLGPDGPSGSFTHKGETLPW